MIRVTNAIVLQDSQVEERFLRASGPGGQNLNKEATAVQLRVDLKKTSLPREVVERLIFLAGRHVTNDGVLIVDGRASRSQTQNREAARARLLALLRRAATPPKKRKATRPRADAREDRLVSKKRRSAVKRSRNGTTAD
jgi:ribosome-associated protein